MDEIRDLRLILVAGRRVGVPVLVGSAGNQDHHPEARRGRGIEF
jgi:hypothetical protein